MGGGAYYIHTDHLGTPRVISDRSNADVWRWDSDPFGMAVANEDPDGDGLVFNYNLRFPGQYFDAETGKHYNYFRDYDPATSRYIESDPIGLGGGINTYAYVGGDPINLADILGLKELSREEALGISNNISNQWLLVIGVVEFSPTALRNIATLARQPKNIAQCAEKVVDKAALEKELEQLRKVEEELRAQLNNGRNQMARELSDGHAPNPHGLAKEVNDLIPREIEKVVKRINEISQLLSK